MPVEVCSPEIFSVAGHEVPGRHTMFAKAVRSYSWLIPILFASLCPPLVRAQETIPQDKREGTPAPKALQNVTGCLRKGAEAGEVLITGEDGKTWELRSSSVKLGKHIGHRVTVTGSTTHESKTEEERGGKVENAAGKEEYRDLRVTSLKVISQTCK
jgi:hypothetical protein